MNKLTLLIPIIALAGCANSQTDSISLDKLLENPLFAERYADEKVDAIVEFKIQKDPIIEDPSKEKIMEKERKEWLAVAKDATAKQRAGTRGNLIEITEYANGEALYLEDKLYFGPELETIPSVELHVYLTTVVDPRDIEFPDEQALDLGELQTPYGAQVYNVPHQEDPLLYRTVVIWDEKLEKIWSFAQLSK